MNKFLNWVITYNTEITWCAIGILANNAVMHLAEGRYEDAVVDLLFAGANYYLWKTRS